MNMKDNKMSIAVSTIVFVAVIAFLVFITINKKSPATSQAGNEAQESMNIQQVEGVKIVVIREGSGEMAKDGDMVDMNYTGTLTDGSVFDSNVNPKFGHVEPFTFTIGAGEVIKGWDVGITGMKVGEKRTLEIAPDYAYGATGAGGVIPPNATISFEVELLQVKK